MKAKPFLTAEWRNLVMINYEVDPKILLPYLPAKTELDSFEGKYYMSLVAFHFMNTKVKGVAIPFHKNFDEINLRFYVKYKEGGENKRGVVFINEIVPKRAIAFVAKLLYGEKYVYATIKSSITETDVRSLYFGWGEKFNHQLNIQTKTHVLPLEQGSKAQFILEHYWGYTVMKNATTGEYRVAHPTWNIYPVLTFELQVDFEKLYGKDFSFLNNSRPASVFVAEGSPVTVYEGREI